MLLKPGIRMSLLPHSKYRRESSGKPETQTAHRAKDRSNAGLRDELVFCPVAVNLIRDINDVRTIDDGEAATCSRNESLALQEWGLIGVFIDTNKTRVSILQFQD